MTELTTDQRIDAYLNPDPKDRVKLNGPLFPGLTINDPKYKEYKAAFTQAKIILLNKGNVFFNAVAFSVRHVFTDDADGHVPTAATDSKYVYYSPAFFMNCTPEERAGLIMHETLHIAFNHCKAAQYSRLIGRDPMLWNKACDYVINLMVIEMGLKLPKGGLLNRNYREMSSEEVYEVLSVNPDLGAEGSEEMIDLMAPPSTGDGSESDGTGNDNSPDKQDGGGKKSNAMSIEDIPMSEELQEVLTRAYMQAKMAREIGSIPMNIRMRLEELLDPKLPWKTILAREFRQKLKTGHNWAKPNRRYFPQIYLPKIESETVGEVDIAIDLSSSVKDDDVKLFITEVVSLMRMMRPKKVNLIEFNTKVTQQTSFTAYAKLLDHEFIGRGGTKITPVINCHNEKPATALLIFTDGYFREPTVKAKAPTYWLIYNNPDFRAPFGRVIHTD